MSNLQQLKIKNSNRHFLIKTLKKILVIRK